MSESQHIEYKQSFGKETIISLVSFANTSGGKVIVGVDDSGKVYGIESGPETIQRFLNEIKMATYPQLLPKILVEDRDGKKVIVFEVSEYPVKPVSFKNRYYKRVHNSNHILNLDEIIELRQQSLSQSYDAYPQKQLVSELHLELIDQFVRRVNDRGRFKLNDDVLTNLVKLQFVREGRPTLAAILLFGNHGNSIHIGRFKSEATIIDDVVIKSPMIIGVDEALVFIKKHINLSYSFDGNRTRKEHWQFPLEAIRELLLNSIVHRDYKNASDIVIKIFDDRIIFTNPGKIFGNQTIQDLERNDYISSLRNKLLAEAFYLTGDIEKYGTGFIRIRESLEGYPDIKFSFSEQGDFFKAELCYTPKKTLKKTPKKTLKKTPKKVSPVFLTELEQLILSAIKKDNTITLNRLAGKLNLSKYTVAEYTDKLKVKHVLQRIGSKRSGYWHVTETSADAKSNED